MEREDIFVTIIIAAYNEEKVIESKLRNTLELDYPPDNMEIIVASDGSTDKTDEIVHRFSSRGVILNRVEGRKGKTEVQNQTVPIAKGDIIIFSDANALYGHDAVRKIVQNFNDTRVGGVCGKLVYLKSGIEVGDEEDIYWSFENFLKQRESILSSTLGSTGSIYAIRKDLYKPLPYYIISDFVEPLKVVEQGYRVVYENDAISKEHLSTVSGAGAFERRVRINNRTILGLFSTLSLLNIRKYGFVPFQLFSHKILRYLMPFVLVGVFLSNIFLLNSAVWKICFILQCLFYSFSLIGYLRRKNPKQSKVFSLPWFFVWTHLAIILAWLRFLKGKKYAIWETQRIQFPATKFPYPKGYGLKTSEKLKISIIIPTYNEENNIGTCLDTILKNNHPQDLLEILVIDGHSTDKTVDIVKAYAEQYSNIKIYHNPDKVQVFALNIGIQNVSPSSDVMMRADAHSVFPENYISLCAETLINTGASCVGGIMKPVGKTRVQRAIAFCMSHPLGVGDAKFHLGGHSGYVDTVYLGFYRKEVFERIGLYDTRFFTNEDAELNLRIIESGGKIYLNHKIQVDYFPRKTLWALAKQYFKYGEGRAKTVKKHRRITSLRQVVPPLFVLSIVFTIILSVMYFSIIFPLFFSIYILILITSSIVNSIIHKSISILISPIAFFTMHASWGLGFLKNLFFYSMKKLPS